MSDQPAPPPPEQPISESALPPAAPRSKRAELVLWVYGLGILVLAAAVFYLWRYPATPAETVVSASAFQAAEGRLEAVDSRLSHLEQQPTPPTPADFDKILARLDKLETRVSDQAQLASRLDVLSGRIESLSGRGQSGLDAIKQQLDQDADRVTALEKTVDSNKSVSERVDRIVHIQAAEIALATGRPLGELPDAPPALSRFAHIAPPTLAQLRLAFPQVEGAASATTQSSTASGPFVDRVWERAQGLLTIRQGNQVVVGDASAVALARAKNALQAGDLVAAVDALTTLRSNAQRAVADWLAEAKALIDARSALADMAARI